MMEECNNKPWMCSVTGDYSLILDRMIIYMTPTPQDVVETGDDFFSDEDNSANPEQTDGLISCKYIYKRDTDTASLASQGNNENVANFDEVDGLHKRDSGSSTSSSSSCESGRDSRPRIRRKSRKFQSLWSREPIFSLQSLKNPRDRTDVFHVVSDVHRAVQNGLRKNDRVIEINERDVRRESPHNVDIIWRGLSNVSKVKLKVWRWEEDKNGPNIREVRVVFHPVQPNCLIREISKLSLSDKIHRKAKSFTWSEMRFLPFHIRIASETGIYVSANTTDMSLYGEQMELVPGDIDRFRFSVKFFSCILEDEDHGTNARVGFVAQFIVQDTCFDVSSVIAESTSSIKLKPHVPYDTDNLDERFILKLEVPQEDNFFESLAYKNVFMKYNNDSKKLLMRQCEGPGPNFLFEMFETRGPNFDSTLNISSISDMEADIFVFEPIKENDENGD
ncbi:uncharacterized protein LOC133181291 [Saccostrea echinata]|uniref:uncharacterized protein LOC133181291 n=1 Tax=Saccostrea echinata TaxID=191078 RepID=UPI002A8328F5|nr:uncharacterized protein LOC133181291 [Saccostrea echinata]